jgi:hypothetical protein
MEISKILLLQIAIFLTVGLVADILGKRYFQGFIVSLALLTFSFPATYSNFKTSVTGNQKIALSTAKSNSEYQEQIKVIVRALSNRSSANVVVQMNSTQDYERAYAIIQYIQYYSRGTKFFLNLQIPSVSTGLETALLAQLSDIQLNGSKKWNVQPKPTELRNNNLCIIFNRTTAVPSVCEVTYGA